VTAAAIIWCLTLSEQNLLSPHYILILEIAMSIQQSTFINYYGKSFLAEDAID